MDVEKMISELRAQRDQIEHAILALERLRATRRGRPPKWATAQKDGMRDADRSMIREHTALSASGSI